MTHLKRTILGLSLLALAGLQALFAADVEHVVQKGDTLYHISKLYGVPIAVLLEVNHIPNARSLKVGMKLEIPQTYQVQKGDTLYSIARDSGVSLSELVSINHIGQNHIIKAGELLVLPPGAARQPSTVSNDGQSGSAGSGDIVSTSASSTNGSESSGQAVSMASESSHFWPASGRRIFLSGKLAGGTQISGSVGDPVYAVAPGRVVWVGPYRGYGRVVFVESQTGYIYVYGGAETTLVKVGESVIPGTEVANMGVNPHLGQACTYFFVYKNGKPVDPKTAPRR